MYPGASLIWLVGLVVVQRVRGTPDCAPASNTLTIRTPQDVTDLSTCTTFTGNIVVAADGPSDIVLDGLQTVSGNIDIENVSELRSLSSNSLQSMAGFTLNNLPLLESLQLPALRNFSTLLWTTLPNLSNCTIAAAEITGEIQNITIANTALPSLDWLAWPIGAGLNITANTNLTSFKIPYATINSGSAITLSSNPALQTVDVSLLTGIYGGLAVSESNISTLEFDKLQNINGFVQLNGAYTNISMPALAQVVGALRVQSTADISPFCSSLQAKKLAGHYDCVSSAASATGSSDASASSTPSDGAVSASDSTERAAIGGVIGGIFLSLLVALGAYWFMRRRARKQVQEIAPLGSKDVEAGSVDSVVLPRVSGDGIRKELAGSDAAVEMAAQERASVGAPAEMDGVVRSELQGKRATVRYELAA